MSLITTFIAALVAFVIGVAWFSPILFGKPWARLSGVSDSMRGLGWITPSLILLVALIASAYVLSTILIAMGAFSIATGMEAAFWTWLGFSAAHGIAQNISERRPFALFAITSGYFLVAMLAMGAILAVW